jgi:hypothetical protein
VKPEDLRLPLADLKAQIYRAEDEGMDFDFTPEVHPYLGSDYGSQMDPTLFIWVSPVFDFS